MDADSFDHLTKSLPVGTRRGAVRLLATVPFAGVLASLLDEGEPAQADGSGAGTGVTRRNRHHRRRKHHPGDDKKNQDRNRGKDGKGRSSSSPDCICPPDARFAAVEACRARPGAVAVPGECDCAWLSGDPEDFPCRDTCLCWLTVEGTGFCGVYSPPLPTKGIEPCPLSGAPCPPFTTATGLVFDTACVHWADGGGQYCWPACEPREP